MPAVRIRRENALVLRAERSERQAFRTTDIPVVPLLEGANRADPPGEILVVVMHAAVVGEVDVVRHVGRLLRRGPVPGSCRPCPGRGSQRRQLPSGSCTSPSARRGTAGTSRRSRSERSVAQRSAAVPRSAHAATMSCVFCRPVPIAVPRAPLISVRKHPHFAPRL